MKHNKRGFTLVEVIAVLVIIAVAAVIAVPNVVGYVSRNKEQNCTLALESLLSKIQTTCAVERYLSSEGVSADIINAVSQLEGSVKGAPATSFELTLDNFCNDKNTVYVSWEIKDVTEGSAQTGFEVSVTARCEDGNIGTNEFECGYKSDPVDSVRTSLADRIESDILSSDSIKTAYTSGTLDDIIAKVAEITKIAPGKFNEVKACISALEISDAVRNKNFALSMCLTYVINEKEIYKNAFYRSHSGEGYMPIVAYTGGAQDIYDSDKAFMGKGGFMIFGLRSASVDDYFSAENIDSNFKNGAFAAFLANCVWNEDYSKAYFLRDASAVKTVPDIVFVYDSIVSGTNADWVSE